MKIRMMTKNNAVDKKIFFSEIFFNFFEILSGNKFNTFYFLGNELFFKNLYFTKDCKNEIKDNNEKI